MEGIDLTQGMAILSQFMRSVDIEVDGCIVRITYVLEMPSEELAKALAKNLQEQLGGR